MEYLNFEFPAALAVRRRAHVGVVGSGDMEILLLPAQPGEKAAGPFGRRCWGAFLRRIPSRPHLRSTISVRRRDLQA